MQEGLRLVTYTDLRLYCWKSQGNVGQRRGCVQTQQVHWFILYQKALLGNQVLEWRGKPTKVNLQAFYLCYFMLVSWYTESKLCTSHWFASQWIRKITVPVKTLLFLRKRVWDYSLVSKSDCNEKLKSWGFLDHLINFSSTQHQFFSSTGLWPQETQLESIQWIKDYIQLNHEYGCIKPLPRFLWVLL